MPNSLSFFLTTTQMRSRSKTVTRRLRCKLKPGELFWAVVKKQGLKKGEKVERIVLCRCLKNDPSVLNGPDLTIADVAREGFPEMSPDPAGNLISGKPWAIREYRHCSPTGVRSIRFYIAEVAAGTADHIGLSGKWEKWTTTLKLFESEDEAREFVGRMPNGC